MKITFKLFATLSDYLPARALGNEIEIDVPEKSTPNDVIDRFNVPQEMVHLVLLNGVYLSAEERKQSVMHTGDALAVWPPVAGG